MCIYNLCFANKLNKVDNKYTEKKNVIIWQHSSELFWAINMFVKDE